MTEGHVLETRSRPGKRALTGVDEGGEDGLVPLLGRLHQDPQRALGRQHGQQV